MRRALVINGLLLVLLVAAVALVPYLRAPSSSTPPPSERAPPATPSKPVRVSDTPGNTSAETTEDPTVDPAAGVVPETTEPWAIIDGRVEDQHGRVVTGVFAAHGYFPPREAEYRVRDDGTFTVCVPEGKAELVVAAAGPGYLRGSRRMSGVVAGETREVLIVLQPGATHEGRVLTAGGERAADVHVGSGTAEWVPGGYGTEWIRTDAAGRFRHCEIPPGRLCVEAVAGLVHTELYCDGHDSLPEEIRLPAHGHVRVAIQQGAGVPDSEVRRVTFLGLDGLDLQRYMPREDVSLVAAPPGRYLIDVSMDMGFESTGELIDVRVGGTHDVTISVTRNAVRDVRLRIVDGDGKPVAGAKIRVMEVDDYAEYELDATATQLVTLPAEDTDCMVRVTAPGFAIFDGEPAIPDGDPPELQIELAPEATLDLTLWDHEGRPVPIAKVEATGPPDFSFGDVSQVIEGHRGVIRNLIAGEVKVTLSTDDGVELTRTFAIEAEGQQSERMELPAPFHAALQVHYHGQPLGPGDVRVESSPKPGQEPVTLQIEQDVTYELDSAGTARVKFLSAGLYRISVRSEFRDLDWQAVYRDVAGSGPLQIDLEVGQLAFRLLDPEGEPLPHQPVEIKYDTEHTDELGRVTFGSVAAGSYGYWIRNAPEGVFPHGLWMVQPTAANDTGVRDLRLQGGRRCSLRVHSCENRDTRRRLAVNLEERWVRLREPGSTRDEVITPLLPATGPVTVRIQDGANCVGIQQVQVDADTDAAQPVRLVEGATILFTARPGFAPLEIRLTGFDDHGQVLYRERKALGTTARMLTPCRRVLYQALRGDEELARRELRLEPGAEHPQLVP